MGSIPIQEIIPDKISNLIRRQFPDWYLEHGQVFVDFVQAYYQYLESPNNPLYYSRKYYDIKDVDFTLSQFVVHFKEKYLKNIQLSTQANTAQIIKHCLDIYRSKSTQRCVTLLFQLVFNQQPQYYYPSTDLFKLSDGQWFLPQYLELLLSDNNVNIVGKQVKGVSSGATAFVEDVVRRYTVNRLEDVAYVSAIQGNFNVWEKIIPTDASLTIQQSPTIIGSLTNVQLPVTGVGQGFSPGQVVTLSSQNGNGAIAVVTDTVNTFGLITTSFNDGGYGYTNTAIANDNIYIANAMFTISNLQIVNTGLIQYFSQFDSFVQPQVYLNYLNATGAFSPGDSIFTYFANGSTMGQGTVIQTNANTANQGTLLVGVVSGNVAFDPFFNTGNVSASNLQVVNAFMQANATGIFMANDDYIFVYTNNVVNGITSFVNENIYQPSCTAIIQGIVPFPNGITQFQISNIEGVFKKDYSFTGLSSGAMATPTSISIGVGLSNVSAALFSTYANNTVYCYTNSSYSNLKVQGTISKVELGSGFSISLGNSLLFSETILLNNDLLANYLTTNINATAYGFPANTSANLTSRIVDSLTYVNTTIGKIQSVTTSNPGSSYTKPPFIALDYPIRTLQYHDILIQISGATDMFQPGDIVTQTATNARGMVKLTTVEADETTNTTQLYVQNMRFYQNNWFIPTTNNTTTIVASSTGTSANIVNVFSDDDDPAVMGYNFDMDTNFTVGIGAIANLTIRDSGFGFVNNESIFINGDTFTNGIAVLLNQGISQGRYRKKGGFLSDQKKLFDGYFYQNYSYQIISSLTLDRYQTMLQEITHPAGTIMFGKLQYNNIGNNVVNVQHAGLSIFNVYPQVISSIIINANPFIANTSKGRAKTLSLTLNDGISLIRSNVKTKAINVTLLDTTTRIHNLGRGNPKLITVTLSDAITTTRNIGRGNPKSITVTLLDTVSLPPKQIRKIISPIFTDTVQVIKPIRKIVSPITLADTVQRTKAVQKVSSITLAETVTLPNKTTSKIATITLADTLFGATRTISKVATITLIDTPKIIKSVNKKIVSITLHDTITLAHTP